MHSRVWLLLVALVGSTASPGSSLTSYHFDITVLDGSSTAHVVETFNAVPVHGAVFRDILYLCDVTNVSASTGGKSLRANYHGIGELASVPNGYGRVLVETGHNVTTQTKITLGPSTSAMPHDVLVTYPPEYDLANAVRPVPGKRFAVYFGLPPCELHLCPQYSLTSGAIHLPANATSAKTELHLPANMFKHIALSGATPNPNEPTTLVSHSTKNKQPWTDVTVAMTQDVNVKNTVFVKKELINSPDNIAVLISFDASHERFTVGRHSCFPTALFPKTMDSSVAKGGASLMLELGGAIVFVCAGMPLLIGFCCLLYIRCIKKQQPMPAPNPNESVFSAYSYKSRSDRSGQYEQI